VGVDVRTHLDFLDLDRLLLLAGFSGFLLGLELEAAVIESLADGRDRIRRYLDKIEAGLGRDCKGAFDRDGAEIGALGVDKLNFADANLFVDPGTFLGRCRGCSMGPANGQSPLSLKTIAGLPPCSSQGGIDAEGFLQSRREVNRFRSSPAFLNAI
jgi:hypothetical protein